VKGRDPSAGQLKNPIGPSKNKISKIEIHAWTNLRPTRNEPLVPPQPSLD
jgi:hypothetical protein